MHTKNTNTVEMEVFIEGLDLTNLDIFVKHYTMQEHFLDIPRKEGILVAQERYPEQRVAVHVKPVSDTVLEDAIRSHLHIHTSEKLHPRVHNPMCASFLNYKKVAIMGRNLLILKGTVGLYYAEVNRQWQLEFLSNINS